MTRRAAPRMIVTLIATFTTFATAGAATDSSHSVGSVQLAPCTLSTAGWPLTVTAQCGRIEVPEDRNQPDGRMIELAVAMVASSTRRPEPDPVVLLAGGPGQSALESYPALAPAFADLLRQRNVLLVDQRGTGGSHALACPEGDDEAGSSAGEVRDPAAARRLAQRCLESLDADPRFYTTTDAVQDLEAVAVDSTGNPHDRHRRPPPGAPGRAERPRASGPTAPTTAATRDATRASLRWREPGSR